MNFVPHDYQAYAIDYIETHPWPQSCSIWVWAKLSSP